MQSALRVRDRALGFQDLKSGDVIETYDLKEIARI